MKIIKSIKSLIIILLVILLAILLFVFIKKFNSSTDVKHASLNSGAVTEQTYLAKAKISLEKSDKVIGDRNAALKIFVYEDNANIYSAELADNLRRLYDENKNRLAIIVRPFFSQRNVLAREAALLVECAADEGKWLEMRDFLFKMAKTESLELNSFLEYGREVGLSVEALQMCLTSQEKYAKIDWLVSEADIYGVTGAPTIFIDEEMIPGARPYDDYADSDGELVDGLKTVIEKRLTN